MDPRNLKRLDSTRRFKFHPLFGREGVDPGSATRQKPDHLAGERLGDPDDSLHFPSASEGVEDLCSTTCITSKTGVGIVDPPRLDRGGPILGAQFLTRMGCVEWLEFPTKNADAPSSFSRKVFRILKDFFQKVLKRVQGRALRKAEPRERSLQRRSPRQSLGKEPSKGGFLRQSLRKEPCKA